METKDFIQEKQRSVNWQITLKVFIIGIITLALLVPKFMIIELTGQRQATAELSSQEVMQSWSLAQTVRGPVLAIPYTEPGFDLNGNNLNEEKEFYILPRNLKIDGEIFPEKRKRSIYETVVYDSEIDFSGVFEISGYETLKILPENILWEKAKILVAVNDLRGINNRVEFNWNDSVFAFSPGMENILMGTTGISLQIPGLTPKNFPADFQFTLHLKGSQSLSFAPLGELTDVTLRSPWNDPGFTGKFLPEAHSVTNDGFTASWKVLNFNRNFPQQWKNDEFKVVDADFGVRLITLASHYQKSSRAAKYGILVIVFVFLAFFLNEVITHQKVHPFQYILVGFAILIFYLMLLSIAEHLGFNPAYLISSVSVLIMVLLYSHTFLKKWKFAFIQTLILAFSFGFIFVLMQLETYALLIGSIGLFNILALTMFVTRKINWYGE